jgi:excisionase family DNA binding protein
MVMEEQILTLDEAAAYLQIGKRSLYKLVKAGDVPGRKVLSRWRFEKESLRKWVAQVDTQKRAGRD